MWHPKLDFTLTDLYPVATPHGHPIKPLPEMPFDIAVKVAGITSMLPVEVGLSSLRLVVQTSPKSGLPIRTQGRWMSTLRPL
jgi:hypothetical protein